MANLFATLISSALRITAIVALYYLDHTIVQIVAAFMRAFFLILATVTNARRAEIFGLGNLNRCAGSPLWRLYLLVLLPLAIKGQYGRLTFYSLGY